MRALALPLIACATVTMVARAHAQGAAPAPPGDHPPASAGDEAPPPSYEAHIEEAIAESGRGHWEEARAAFRAAHRVFPNARTLRGIGMTSYELRDYTAAYRALSAALAEERRALSPEQREQVAALRERARALIAIYTLATFPEDAELYVDGARREVDEGGRLLMAPGRHEVEVRVPGRAPTRGSWTVRGGEDGELPLALPAPDLAATSPRVGAAVAVDAGMEASHPRTARDRLAVAATSVGSALAGAGVALLALGIHDVATVENASPGTPWDQVQAADARAPKRIGAGVAVMAVGVAAAAAGVALLWTRDRAPAGPELRVAVTPSSASVEARW